MLTSLSDADLVAIGYQKSLQSLVEQRVRQAIDAGLDGVVTSPREAALARRIGGPAFLVVTPGVRPTWAGADDQARAATPAEALAAGASHVVCGRPITAAADPREAALTDRRGDGRGLTRPGLCEILDRRGRGTMRSMVEGVCRSRGRSASRT